MDVLIDRLRVAQERLFRSFREPVGVGLPRNRARQQSTGDSRAALFTGEDRGLARVSADAERRIAAGRCYGAPPGWSASVLADRGGRAA